MSNQIEQGYVIEWGNLQLGRGNNDVVIPVTMPGITDADPLPWKQTAMELGAYHLKNYLEKCRVMREDAELGPMPLLPYWGPNSQLGISLPAPGFLGGGAVIAAQLKSNPHTFIRGEKIQFLNVKDVAFHLGMSMPRNSIADANGAFGTSAEQENGIPSWGWHVVSYGAQENLGSQHSCWFFWKDSELFSAIIEHRTLNSDGSESDLTDFWKPRDIWLKVIKPRIALNLPIRRFGIQPETVEGEQPTINLTFTDAGEIQNTRFIQAASYAFPIEPMFLEDNITTWTASVSDAFPHWGAAFSPFPGWWLPNLAYYWRYLIDQGISFLELTEALGTQSTNCFAIVNHLGEWFNMQILIQYLKTIFQPVQP